MQRRDVLGSVAATLALAGCPAISSDDTPSSPRGTDQPGNSSVGETPVATPTTLQPISEADDPEWLIDAYHYELELSGVSVDDAKLEGETIVLDVYESSSHSDLLQVGNAYYTEVLQQNYEAGSVRVWFMDTSTEEFTSRVTVDSEWILAWLRDELTRGQYLANIYDTEEEA
jgi:hypothetical protein